MMTKMQPDFCHTGPMLSTILFSTLLLIGCCLLCPPQAGAEDIKTGIQYTENSYHIGPGDLLSFQVYNQTDLTGTDILVREDGHASFNGLGEVSVSGMTVDELTQLLTQKAAKLIINPIVTVNITQTRPGTIYLAGAVNHPGMYQLTSSPNKNSTGIQSIQRVDLRLSNVLANAGGVATDADLSSIAIKQASGATRTVDLWKMLKEGSGEEDVWLQSGDSVIVPALKQAAMSDADYGLLLKSAIGPATFPIRIIGEVNAPGVFDLAGNSPYLNSAVAKAGGYKPSANLKVLAIRRINPNNQFTTLVVDPSQQDMVLKPNDIVYVSELKIYKAGRFMETAAKVLSPFTNIAQTAINLSILNSVK